MSYPHDGPSSMRIVFVGAVDFSRHCLERTIGAGGNVVSVLGPHRESARHNADYVDLAVVAEIRGLPFKRFDRISDPEVRAYIADLVPDIMFVFGLSQLLDERLLSLPRLGTIGVHPTLLPEGRGRHPLIWALVKGLERSGLSFFYMDTGADAGDILWQKSFAIGPDDTAADLYDKIKALANEAIPEFLPQLASGTAPRIPQDPTRVSVWPRRGEKDGEIDWTRSAREIHNLIRALSKPYVGAHTFVGGTRMVAWQSRLRAETSVNTDAPPGTIVELTAEGLTVQTGDFPIELTDWQPRDHAALKAGAVLGATL